MIRPGALALAVLVASGVAAQTPRYVGVELSGVAHESCIGSEGSLFPPAGGDREGGDVRAPSRLDGQPPLSPPGQEGDCVRDDGVDLRTFSDTVADTTHAPPDAWLGRDKALHAGASFLLTLSGQYVLVDKAELSNSRALPISVGTALALGLLKEVSDSRRERHPLFSWRDLAADAAGVALAIAVVAW